MGKFDRRQAVANTLRAVDDAEAALANLTDSGPDAIEGDPRDHLSTAVRSLARAAGKEIGFEAIVTVGPAHDSAIRISNVDGDVRVERVERIIEVDPPQPPDHGTAATSAPSADTAYGDVAAGVAALMRGQTGV